MGKDALLAERATLINRKDDDFSDPNVVQLLGKLKLLEHNRKTEQMKKRKTEDLFVPDLSALREEIALLKSFENDHHIKDIVKVDQFAVEPSETIRPNRLFLVLGAMILGGAVGVALVICIFASKLVQTRNSSVS
ncbi:hypothetical protein [Pseudomonas sp. TUM22785]|uniref:hypothetical protein n=1 Tax=Pseudomonas sp. TUM22785 TaxID=3019098 RepID=UPI0023067C8B|nr:hypothetical protein [Pseudomonas sp. TUM22785]WCD82146.1 hypothetical protein PI990_09050 [Pseudomonas sp. TUM22785]